MRRAGVWLLGWLGATVLLAACAAPAAPASPTSGGAPSHASPSPAPTTTSEARPSEKVRLAYSALTAVAAVPVLAQERGRFAAHHLDAEVQYIASGTTAMQALLAGEIQLLVGGTEAVLSAAAAGADLRIVAGLVDVVPFSLMVRPEIATAEDLRGQRLGITRLGSATDYALRQAVRRFGLDPDRDVALAQMGGVPEILAGMESGAVAGGTLSLPPLAQARRAGYRELLDLAAADLPYQTTSVAVTAQFARERPETVQAALRAMAEAIHLLKTDRATAIATFAALNRDDDPQVLEETYERYALHYIVAVPAPNRAGIAAVQEQLAARDPRLAALALDTLIDERPIRALEAEGLFARLYPRS